jgi:E3 ubiquitin-protein ligase MARCH6
MTYSNAFTRQFWYNLANEAFEDDDVGQNNGRAPRAPGDNVLAPGAGDGEHLDYWQGQNGRVGRFIGVVKAVVLKWEWDRVDPDILVHHFLLPIVQTLGISLLAPITFYASWHLASMAGRHETSGVIVPYFGRIEEGMYRLLIFRICMILTFGCQFMVGFQSQLKDWFQLAHKAARDDRYLVGEVLLNYAEKLST